MRRLKKTFIMLGFSAFTAGLSLWAQEAVVTRARMSGTEATVVVNDVLEIRHIQIVRQSGTESVLFPAYTAKSGRRFPEVTAETKMAKEKILRVLQQGESQSGPTPLLEWTFKNVHLLSGSSRLANVEVTFNREFTVVFGVLRGRSLWVAMPGKKNLKTKKYEPSVLILDKSMEKKLKSQILEAYRRTWSEGRVHGQ